jgi:hypothetical protein
MAALASESAFAEPRPLPSLRLSMGAASVERADGRSPGFAGHLDLGLSLVTYRSATDIGTYGDMLVDTVLSPAVDGAQTGLIARLGVGYDRTGSGGDAARNFAFSAQIGYGYSVLQASLGTAFLTGRVAGDRARGVRLDAVFGVYHGASFMEIANDFWFAGDARRRDFRVVLGVDVLVLAYIATTSFD